VFRKEWHVRLDGMREGTAENIIDAEWFEAEARAFAGEVAGSEAVSGGEGARGGEGLAGGRAHVAFAFEDLFSGVSDAGIIGSGEGASTGSPGETDVFAHLVGHQRCSVVWSGRTRIEREVFFQNTRAVGDGKGAGVDFAGVVAVADGAGEDGLEVADGADGGEWRWRGIGADALEDGEAVADGVEPRDGACYFVDGGSAGADDEREVGVGEGVEKRTMDDVR
jgi:hypothetical protein